MNWSRYSCLTFGFLLFVQSYATTTAAGQHLEVAGKFPRSHVQAYRSPVPVWHNGYMVTYGLNNEIIVADKSGAFVTHEFVTQVSVDSVVHQIRFLNATAVSRTGRIAFSFTTPQSASGIAWMSSSGNVELATMTDDFGVVRLSFDPDGTLWAQGRSARKDFLVHFDASGRQLPTLVEFPRDGGVPNFEGWVNGLNATSRVLVNNGERIGLLGVARHIWLELAPDGQILGQWALPPGREVKGTALTSSGEAYVSARFPFRQEDDPETYDADDRLFRLNRDSGQWDEVETAELASEGEEWFTLQGADGDDLVIRAHDFPYDYLIARVVP